MNYKHVVQDLDYKNFLKFDRIDPTGTGPTGCPRRRERSTVATVKARDAWISRETEAKEADFRGLLNMHITISKAIINRHSAPPYLYADLYAGPGHLEFEGRRFPGSPLIAQDLLTRAGVPYEAIHFEKDPDVAERLRAALWTPTTLLDVPDATNTPVFNESFQDAFPKWLRAHGRQADRYGLVYADPIRDEIPHGALNLAAELLPKVDLLSYVSATQYKRRRRSAEESRGIDLPLLGDHIAAVNKRIALIRKPLGAWQWTFVLWSNWVKLPDWQNRGFYRLDSDEGRRILDVLDLTAREQKEKANTPLPFPAAPAPLPRRPDLEYRTYREYLRHPRFLAVREQVFRRAGGRCERCRAAPPTEPHHLRYPPWGEFDVPQNMVAVCHPCHCIYHGKEN
jgi:hypothetical protein